MINISLINVWVNERTVSLDVCIKIYNYSNHLYLSPFCFSKTLKLSKDWKVENKKNNLA